MSIGSGEQGVGSEVIRSTVKINYWHFSRETSALPLSNVPILTLAQIARGEDQIRMTANVEKGSGFGTRFLAVVAKQGVNGVRQLSKDFDGGSTAEGFSASVVEGFLNAAQIHPAVNRAFGAFRQVLA